jgi:hypothetical protein
MLEHTLAELFEQQASETPPPTRASVAAATRQGRTRRRMRQAGLAASPVLAAGAVLGIAIGGIIPTGAYHVDTPPTAPAASGTQAPRLFNPLRSYVAPGWLPDGLSVVHLVALFSRLEDEYSAPDGVAVNVYARGVCRLSSRAFTCGWPRDPLAPELPLPRRDIGRRIGDLSRHGAYWMFPAGPGLGTLTWQYAAGGWARVSAPGLQDALRMARSLRFGKAAEPLVAFPFQLTGVPVDWRVNSVATQVHRGVRYAFSFSVTAGPVDTTLGLVATPRQVVAVQTGPEYGTSCESYFRHASHRLQIINGNETFVLLRPQAWDTGAESGLCTVTDGVLASVITERQAPISATDLLADHIHFLGPDPAKWTTRPIG